MGVNIETAYDSYTRVTSVLYPFSGLEKIPVDIVRNAGDRGTKVHNICEGIISGLGEFGIDDETRPYVESFKKWWSQGHQVVLMEERFYDHDMLVTGKVDLILMTNDGYVILDLKTSAKPSKTWAVQGSAYAHLAKLSGYDIQKIQFLHLSKIGAEPKIYEYPIDIDLWHSTHRAYKYFFHKTPKTTRAPKA